MKLKRGSVLTLVLVLKTVVWASNVGLPKSQRLADALEAHGKSDVEHPGAANTYLRLPNGGRVGSFELGAATKDLLKDPLLPKEISELVTSFAKPSSTVTENEVNECKLSSRVLAQISKPSASDWFVDDHTMSLLGGDLQLLIDCTQPQDRLVFVNSQLIRAARTLKIVHELDFFCPSLHKYGAKKGGRKVASFTCPDSGPMFSVYATKFTATNLSILHCAQSSNSAAIVVEGGSDVTLNQLTFKGNTNRAIYVKKGANLILDKSDLEDNKYAGQGGAIFVEGDSTIHISKSTFKGNSATNGRGGVVYFNHNNSVVVKDSTFTDNAASKYGGVMYFDEGNAAHIEGSKFTYNIAKYDGGAMNTRKNNTINVLRSTFANNQAQRAGAAMYLYNENKLSIRETMFANNKAKTKAGAIRLFVTNSLSVLTSVFKNNTCGDYGGAIAASDSSILIIRRSVVSNNVAGQSGGGIIVGTGNSLTTIDSTFIHNTAPDGGALVLYMSNLLGIEGCALKGNRAKNYGGALYLNANNKGAIFDSSLSNNHAGHSSGPYGAAIYSNEDTNSLLLSNSSITSDKRRKTIAAFSRFSKSASRRVSYNGITF